MRAIMTAWILHVCVLLPAGLAQSADSVVKEKSRLEPWSTSVVEDASLIPVQEGGRIKPLSTFATFRLLQLSGRRSLKIDESTRLSSIEWLLDVLFYPEQARSYPVFLVEDRDVLSAIGSDVRKKKRDWYSYEEILPRATQLVELGRSWSKVDEKEQTPLEGQVIRLAQNFLGFHDLLMSWEGLHLFPPPAGERAWMSAGELSQRIELGDGGLEGGLESLNRLAELFAARGETPFEADFGEWSRLHVDMADQRGEYNKIGMEVSFYRAQYFFWAQWLFVVGFLFASAVFLKPSSAILYHLARLWLLCPLGFLVVGIVIRCILRDRPPVSTLYETILFITAVGVLVALVAEWINRQGLAQLLAAALGAAGMFFAGWYEDVSAVDTMPQLQAVLDTNFWLSTHVTTVTMGYSAGLLAAAIAHVYILGKLFGIKRNDPDFYRTVDRMIYGAVAFGVVFSTVGTILGGIWANDSWGRFWGWDPKENGALMIVLANLMILHARMGGYIRGLGTSLAAILLGTVVAFSWFHTNLLGVGLHSYGFDRSLHDLVWGYYIVEWSVFALGLVIAIRQRTGSVNAT